MVLRSIDLLAGLSLAIVLVVIAVYSYVSAEFAIVAFARASIYCMYLCLGTFFVSAVRVHRSASAAGLFRVNYRDAAIVTLTAIAVTLSCIWLVGLSFAVLADEAHLVSISQGLYESGEPRVLHQAIRVDSEYTALEEMVPTRPLLFPTLILPLHSLLGYDSQNGQILNALLFIVLLSGVGMFAMNALSIHGAIALQLCVAAQPLLIWSAMSGGFDMLAMMMLALAVTAFWIDIKLKNSSSAWFLWSVLLAYSMVRYESPLIVALIGFCFVLQRRRDGVKRLTYISPLLLTAFSLYPILWQYLLADHKLTRDREGARFSFDFFITHTGELFTHLFTKDAPFNPLISGAFVVGLIVFGFRQLTSRRHIGLLKNRWLLLGLACSAGLTALYLSYWAGEVGNAVSGRFFLVFGFSLSLIAVGTYLLLTARSQVAAVIAVAFSLSAFGVGVFQVKNNGYFTSSLAPWELRCINQYIDAHPGEGKLYVYYLPVEITMRGESAARARSVNEETSAFAAAVQHSNINEIIVFQVIFKETGQVHPLTALRPDITMELLESYEFGLYEFRVSRVTRLGNLEWPSPKPAVGVDG